jgi:hypothetical protein
MPRLVKGAKWTYGWVVVGPRGEITIPPQAWREFGFQAGDVAIFTPGSRKPGGFAISTSGLTAEAGERMRGAGPRELGRSEFCDGWVNLPPEVRVSRGDRLLTVRGSCYGLGFVARGPIYDEALNTRNWSSLGRSRGSGNGKRHRKGVVDGDGEPTSTDHRAGHLLDLHPADRGG